MEFDQDIERAFDAARRHLRDRLHFAGMSQRDLAARMALGPSTLSERIRGPKLEVWAEMSDAWPVVRRILVQLLRDLADAHEREADQRSNQAEDEAMRLLERARGLMRGEGDSGET